MFFNFYSRQMQEATKTIASVILTIGAILILLGVLILVLPAIFVTVAAGLFFIAGFSFVLKAIGLWLGSRKGASGQTDEAYRENVHVRRERKTIEDFFD